MTRQQLVEQIYKKKSYLCVGLDTDISKIPRHLLSEPDPVFTFNKAIIDATKDLCVSYKINTAFYEALGVKGWEAMERTVRYLGEEHFKIADAKRGDIGNTSDLYAKAFFETMPFDAITVAPYMGEDSVRPFLQHKNKWAIVLGLTSNKGANDFELKQMIVRQTTETTREEIKDSNEDAGYRIDEVTIDTNYVSFLYEQVLSTASKWGTTGNLMFVIGATQANEFTNIRKLTPDHFYLVPGVGAQGGSLKEISEKAMIKDCGILVNVSRAIIYASGKNDFAEKAREAAKAYQQEMNSYLK
ncbi:MAG: orotidine-5'-phosphate decarboxylase [Chitinophagaceae bacterium]|nr:orotidine-5'-phosphate decarboxylase [Chitinophagaceae bacterium]